MESSVVYTFAAHRPLAYRLFSSLDLHPNWAPWLKEVEFDKSTGLSHWKMSYLGLRYSWHANNTVVDPPNLIQWESLDGGLPNKGKVQFISEIPTPTTNEVDSKLVTKEMVTMKLTVSYDFPDAAALLLRALGSVASNYISHTLLSDLKRFEAYLEVVRIEEEGSVTSDIDGKVLQNSKSSD
jgi:uncharacterized membrane protein